MLCQRQRRQWRQQFTYLLLLYLYWIHLSLVNSLALSLACVHLEWNVWLTYRGQKFKLKCLWIVCMRKSLILRYLFNGIDVCLCVRFIWPKANNTNVLICMDSIPIFHYSNGDWLQSNKYMYLLTAAISTSYVLVLLFGRSHLFVCLYLICYCWWKQNAYSCVAKKIAQHRNTESRINEHIIGTSTRYTW